MLPIQCMIAWKTTFYGDEIIPDMEEIKPELEMPEIEAELIEFFDDGTDENQSVIAILDVDLSPIEGVPTIVYIPTPPEEFTPTEGADYYVALSDVEPAIDKDLIVLANNQLVYHGEASTQIKLDTDVFTATINDTVPDNQKIDMTQALEQYDAYAR